MVGDEARAVTGRLQTITQARTEQLPLEADERRPLNVSGLDKRRHHRDALVILRGTHREYVTLFFEDAVDADVRQEGDATGANVGTDRIESRVGAIAGQAD